MTPLRATEAVRSVHPSGVCRSIMHWEVWAIVAVLTATIACVARFPKEPPPSPEQALLERYVRGEIDGSEYARQLHELRRRISR